MKLSRIYTEQIAKFPKAIQEELLREAPHTRFGDLPPELEFLGGEAGSMVDMGFENLGLSPDEFKALIRAFSSTGVLVPGTRVKLRYGGMMMKSAAEPADGSELPLPEHWREGVLVVGPDDRPTWIGKRVRPEQYGRVDTSAYEDAGDGLRLVAQPVLAQV